jgi:hypothetical protein
MIRAYREGAAMKRTIALALTIIGSAAVGTCQVTDEPLLTDIRWQTPTTQTDAATAGARPNLQMSVPELSAPPVIDGEIGDGEWDEAAQTEAWMNVSGDRPATVQTGARVGRFGQRLCFAIRCEEPKIAGLVATVTEDGGPAWNDDCVELFFDGNLDLRTYRQIIVNSLGVVTAAYRADADWSPVIERAVSVGEDSWTVELVVPISELAILGSEFGLNLCRERRAGGDTELSCWSPTGKSFGQPASFGLATLGASYLSGFNPGEAVIGLNRVAITMSNPGDKPQRLRARLQYWQGEEIAREAFSFYHELPPGEQREVALPYALGHAREPVNLDVAVISQRGATLSSRALMMPVRAPLASHLSQRVFFTGERGASLTVRLDVGEDLIERGRLVVALFRQPEAALIARQEIAPMQGPAMSARVALPELPAGEYSLHVILKQPGLDGMTRVAEDKHVIRALDSKLW